MLDPRDGAFCLPQDAPPDRLDRVVRAFRPTLSWSQIRDLIARGKVAVGGQPAGDAGMRVDPGVEVRIAIHSGRGAATASAATASAAPATLPRERIVFCDRAVVVVDKPAGIDAVPFEAKDKRQARNAAPSGQPTLDQLVSATLGARVRVVHRLDRDTTGLMMFARSEEAEGKLAHQLRRHTVHRQYLALAHGAVPPATIRSYLADDRGDGLRGSTGNKAVGKEAVTHVEVVKRLRGATLIACRLETGRTHQIRIHLAEAGHMLLGERGYVRDHKGPVIAAPRLMLHAAELGFVHPIDEQPRRFATPLPEDMVALCAALDDS